MRLRLALSIVIVFISAPCWADKTFKDVPNDHWAKETVDMMAQAGVMNGYPDGTFKGEKPVTRYELSVALAKMVEFIQASQKPILTGDTKLEIAPSAHWAAKSRLFLRCEGFLPKDSPVLKEGSRLVACTELGNALALVSSRLIELSVPPTGAPD